LERSFRTTFSYEVLTANKHQTWMLTLSGYKTIIGVIDVDLIDIIKSGSFQKVKPCLKLEKT